MRFIIFYLDILDTFYIFMSLITEPFIFPGLFLHTGFFKKLNMPKKVTGSELRNIKRVFAFNRAVSIMHKKKPWTKAYPVKIIYLLYAIYVITKEYGFAKQRQINDLLRAFSRTSAPGDLKVIVNTGLVTRDNSLGVYSYQLSPKGLELLKEVEFHIKYTRIDKFI